MARSGVATRKPSVTGMGGSTVLTKFLVGLHKDYRHVVSESRAGDVVKESEHLGTVGDFFGDSLAEIICPVNGVILFLTINPTVLENGLLMESVQNRNE
jgi:hypothetical protein